MKAFGAELWGAPGSSLPNSNFRIRKTNWGFAITDTSDRMHGNALEKAMKAMGILLIPIGGMLLLAPSQSSAEGIPLTNIGLAVASAFVGIALFAYAKRGMVKELRVDPYKKEVRLGTLNANGDFTLRRTIDTSAAQSFFLIRASAPNPARLCARMKKGGQVIRLLSGSESELVPVLERISEALRPADLPKKRVRTRVTGAFIHATFA